MSTGEASSGRSSSSSDRSSSAETSFNQAQQLFLPHQNGPITYQYYRRQTPEEDLLSTQQGISILVQQRQELVDQLVQHYRKLYRSKDIDNLLKFSQQIDSIMRLRGFSIVQSPNPRARRRLALPMERGVTIHDEKF